LRAEVKLALDMKLRGASDEEIQKACDKLRKAWERAQKRKMAQLQKLRDEQVKKAKAQPALPSLRLPTRPGPGIAPVERHRPFLQRDFELSAESARGVMGTPSFMEWAGDDLAMLAIVFTDIPGSTALCEELKDERMNEMLDRHFAQSRKLIAQYKGHEIKTIGDSVMAAFKSVEKALGYAMALHANPGHPRLTIRAGVHAGPMTVRENDAFGSTVNYAARVVHEIKDAEIWLSDRAKEYLDKGGAKRFESLKWEEHAGVQMKGFADAATLWSLRK